MSPCRCRCPPRRQAECERDQGVALDVAAPIARAMVSASCATTCAAPKRASRARISASPAMARALASDRGRRDHPHRGATLACRPALARDPCEPPQPLVQQAVSDRIRVLVDEPNCRLDVRDSSRGLVEPRHAGQRRQEVHAVAAGSRLRVGTWSHIPTASSYCVTASANAYAASAATPAATAQPSARGRSFAACQWRRASAASDESSRSALERPGERNAGGSAHRAAVRRRSPPGPGSDGRRTAPCSRWIPTSTWPATASRRASYSVASSIAAASATSEDRPLSGRGPIRRDSSSARRGPRSAQQDVTERRRQLLVPSSPAAAGAPRRRRVPPDRASMDSTSEDGRSCPAIARS